MAPSTPFTPSTPGARDKRGSRSAPSSTYNQGASINANTSGGRGRLATQEVVREVIIIDSDSDPDDDDDETGSNAEPTPVPVPAPLPHPIPSSRSSLKRVPVETQTDRTSTADLLTPKRRFSGFWDLAECKTPMEKTTGLAPRQSTSLVKETNVARRHPLDTPPTLAPLGNPGSIDAPKPMLNTEVDGTKDKKTDTKVGVLRQKPAAAPSTTTAITATRNGTLPRHSSPLLPPMFPPAVKARVYSEPQPSARRNIKGGSKKLEAFGFVSAASLLTETTVPATPIPKPNSISRPIAKPIKKEISGPTEVLQIRSRNPPSTHLATRDSPTAVTPMPIIKTEPISEPTHWETVQVHNNNLRPLPRTPENVKPATRVVASSSSIGTYGDPYAISSDSDSDDDGELRKALSVKSLGSFAETTSTYETASDVEAVLNQFPSWLDSPSPFKDRPSYLATPTTLRPAIKAWPTTAGHSSKRLLDYGHEDEGKEKRRIRFSGGDGFSSSPIPPKRAASPAGRFTSPLLRPATPANRVTNSCELAPPTKHMISTKPIAILGRSISSTARHDASHVASLTEQINSPIKRITACGVDRNPNGHINSDSALNHTHTPDQNQDRNQDQDPPPARGNIPPLERKGASKPKEKKKRKNRKAHSSADKTASRYRNRNRETWRPKKKRK
ncbi:hypothetical protein GGR58DRAFT_380973 [Xylaria digitata]|nr:hypothetical protein GGR58DRAFT_380973 [Xylaria digitata]